jgi:ankyrin repeat protein
MQNDDTDTGIDDKFTNLIAQGDLAAMLSFADLPARVTACDSEGWTPLHWAALYGHAECAGFLIAQGAPVDALSRKGETPLMIAAESRQKEVFAVLLAAGACEDLARANGDTAAAILRTQDAEDMLSVLRDVQAVRGSVLQKTVSVSPLPAVRKRLP